MHLEIRIVDSKKMMNTFIHLPAQLHANYENWMPTLIGDDKVFFNPEKNHQFESCETIMALAYHNDNPVGRIMGIIHLKYNQIRNERNARFGYFDAIDNQEVAHALITYIERWAKQRGIDKLVGPYGFSDKDIQGLLVDGFDKMPLIDSACNPPYIVKLVENEGFVKEIDCMTYQFKVDFAFPEMYRRVQQRTQSKDGFKLVEFKSRRHLKPYIVPVLQLVNITYDHLYGFVPMTDKEMQELAARYLPIIKPEFVKIIEKDGEVVAFIIAIPNFTKGIQKSKGRLFPFGIFYLLSAMKKTRQMDLMLGAVHRSYQGFGLEVLMGMSLIESAKKEHFDIIESHLILENNHRMRAELERLNIPVHKLFRVFRKTL